MRQRPFASSFRLSRLARRWESPKKTVCSNSGLDPARVGLSSSAIYTQRAPDVEDQFHSFLDRPIIGVRGFTTGQGPFLLAEVNAVFPYGKGLDRAQAFVGTISVGMKINGEQGFVFSLEPMVPEPWRLVGCVL